MGREILRVATVHVRPPLGETHQPLHECGTKERVRRARGVFLLVRRVVVAAHRAMSRSRRAKLSNGDVHAQRNGDARLHSVSVHGARGWPVITRVFASARGRTIGGARAGLPHQRLRRKTIDNHTLIDAELDTRARSRRGVCPGRSRGTRNWRGSLVPDVPLGRIVPSALRPRRVECRGRRGRGTGTRRR